MIWEINNGLISLSQEKRRLLFGTVLLCVVQDSVATIGAVGDSPAYLIRKAAISQVAKPPKTYQNLIDTGWYSPRTAGRGGARPARTHVVDV